ncbi:MAG: hypothetical protein M1499_06605 [Firmicutes bacterium]|nr:hypothetical protein [Bacillota bacterium]
MIVADARKNKGDRTLEQWVQEESAMVAQALMQSIGRRLSLKRSWGIPRPDILGGVSRLWTAFASGSMRSDLAGSREFSEITNGLGPMGYVRKVMGVPHRRIRGCSGPHSAFSDYLTPKMAGYS